MDIGNQPAIDAQGQAGPDMLEHRQRFLPVRYLFGDDVFISYARLDATPYAAALASSLADKGFAVRVDQWGTVPSKFVPSSLLRVVGNSSMFILIASAAGAHSRAIQAELEAFLSTKRPIVLIDLDGSASNADWWHLVNGLHRSVEGRTAATSAVPSDEVLEKIANTFTYTRKARRLRSATIWAVSALAVFSSCAVLAGTYAARKVKEARASQVLRDQATKERDQATNEAAQQRQVANGARAETVRQQALTSVAERRTSQALNEQKHAEDETREAIATRMISDGARYLDSRPDVSTNLAFSAARLSSSTHAADLLEASLRRIPMWFEHVPAGANRDAFKLFASDPTDHDPVATDSSMDVLLAPSTAGSMDSLDLYEIPTNRKLSSLRLRNGARLETPKEAGANLIAVGGYRLGKESTGTAIFDLSEHNLEKPAITIPEAKQVAFTKGNWPVYALTKTGRLLSYGAPTTSDRVGTLIGEWPKASEISAFPKRSGAALAILEGNSLIFATVNRQRTLMHKVQLEERSLTSRCNLHWGPTSSQVLVVCSDYGSISVYGVNSANTKVQPMFSAQTGGSALFTASDDGKRFATVTRNKNSGSIVQIADVQWGDSPSVHLQQEDLLTSGNHRANTFGIVNCIALAPNGTALATGTKIMGMSGTTNSVGSIEIWDLSSLNQRTSVSPSSTVLNKGDGSPIMRLAFSIDGHRLLSWDDSHVATVFRVNTDADRTIMQGLAPAEINRLHPQINIFGAGGRFREVKYEGGLVDHIDTLTGHVSDLRSLVRSTQIYDYSMSSSSKFLTVVSDLGISKLDREHILRQIKTPFPVTNGSVADGIALIQSAHSLSVYDSESLERLADCPLDGFKPDWIWAQRLRSGTIWIYAVSTDKSIHVRTWHFIASQALQRTVALNQVDLNLSGLKDNDAFDWFFSEGRAFFQFTTGAISESRLFLASNIKAPSEFRLYDLSTGVRLPLNPPDGLGWPTGLKSMMELIREPAGQFTVLLRYQDFKTSHTSILAATWGHDGGQCLKVIKLDAEGELIYASGEEFAGHHVVLLRSDKGLALVRTSTGKREWASTNNDFFTFPPALTQLPNDRWKVQDNAQYRTTRLRVLLGGEESASQFTSVGLPLEISRSYGNTLIKPRLSRR